MSRQRGWNVYLGYRLIDTVFFIRSMGIEEVRKSLINHDGYPFGIFLRVSK